MTAEAAEPEEPLMTPKEVAAYLGGEISESTLAHWRSRGGGPPFVKAGHFVRYRPDAVQEWLDANVRGEVPA